MLVSALLENLFSMLLAPVLMMFHSIFVLFTIFGLQIKWNPQNRADKGLSLWHCLKVYGWLTVLGVALWPVAIQYLGLAGWWLSPIFAGWILAPFLAWITSGKGLGQFLRKRRLSHHTGGSEAAAGVAGPDPMMNPATKHRGAKAAAAVGARRCSAPTCKAGSIFRSYNKARTARRKHRRAHFPNFARNSCVKARSPSTRRDTLRLLWHGETVFWLHQELWARPGGQLHPSWMELQAESHRSRLVKEYLLR